MSSEVIGAGSKEGTGHRNDAQHSPEAQKKWYLCQDSENRFKEKE